MLSQKFATHSADAIRRAGAIHSSRPGSGPPPGKLLPAAAAEFGVPMGHSRCHLAEGLAVGGTLTASLLIRQFAVEKTTPDFYLGMVSGQNPQQRGGLRFYFGAWSCGAGIVTAGWRTHHKFSGRFDLAAEMRAARLTWEAHAAELPEIAARLKATSISDLNATRRLYTAARKGFLPWSRLGKVDQDWLRSPNKTLWGLAAAFAVVAGESPAHKQFEQMLNFYRLLTGEGAKRWAFGLTRAK